MGRNGTISSPGSVKQSTIPLKTSIETRAQFRNSNSPTPEMIPQIAKTKYRTTETARTYRMKTGCAGCCG